jgi:flagellar basal-body rod protein FlgB
MGDQSLFGGNFPLVEKSLALRSQRHELIVSNIANADTPNFKAFEMAIDQALQKSKPESGHLGLAQTNAQHLGRSGAGADQVTIHRKEPDGLSLRGDGNSVDMDSEMVNLSENNLLYRASAQIMNKMFGSLRTVISGGK